MKTKEDFYNFLKENNFYDAWIEGFILDNEFWLLDITFDKFFEEYSPKNWILSGLGSVIDMNFSNEEFPESTKWRELYLNKWEEIDNKWRQYLST